MTKLFGTDGVRGKANIHPMTPETALALGKAIAYHFRDARHPKRIIIGKDTRRSSYMLEQAIASGICSMGAQAVFTGPLPTPGVAYLTRAMRANAGVMISASHNPFEDNGIKFFDHEGYKLSDEIENELQDFVENKTHTIERPVGKQIGTAYRIDDAGGRYIEFVKNTYLSPKTLDGLKIVIDCANGAAYSMAPQVLWELGAQVVAIGVDPNGTNINNNCGAMQTDLLRKTVLETHSHIGIALDGDADRVILCDQDGQIVDGDQVIALCALSMLSDPSWQNKTIVGTVMTNMGVENFLNSKGISVERTAVGDRYIIERMREKSYLLGGEPSGHIIFANHTTTGDGLIAALQVLSQMVDEQKTLQDLVKHIPLYPQVSETIPVKSKPPLDTVPEVQAALDSLDQRLKQEGRAIVRYSGTEPVLRLMIEGKDQDLIQKELTDLKEIVGAHLS